MRLSHGPGRRLLRARWDGSWQRSGAGEGGGTEGARFPSLGGQEAFCLLWLWGTG